VHVITNRITVWDQSTKISCYIDKNLLLYIGRAQRPEKLVVS